MKIFLKLLFILFVIIFIISIIALSIGYVYYTKALDEKELIPRVSEVTESENFVEFEELPQDYINAVIAIEDHRYYEHGAIDPIGILRALLVNITTGDFSQGGSSITQQVAKNLVFTQEQTAIRKLGELFAAYDLEKNYSKDEILAIYVNIAYFGEGYYGIYEASQGYYGKEPKDLTLEECAMLAGVPNAPSVYAPTVNPDLAQERQQQVLDRMLECGYIDEAEAELI